VSASEPTPDRSSWTFVTSHTLVLLCLASDPDVRLSEIARRVQVSERRVQAIVADLVAAGYVMRTRHGRRNSYVIDATKPLRHLETEHRRLGELLALFSSRARA
jgi:DNA-binding MarR family transcriptional regulator